MASRNGNGEQATEHVFWYRRTEERLAWSSAAEDTTSASVEVVTVKDGAPYGISDDPMADLRVAGYGNAKYRESALWATIEYSNVYSVNLGRAEHMLAVLKRIDKGLDKIREAEGWASDWSTYVGRVARILGVKRLIVESSPRQRDMSGEKYRILTIGEGLDHIRHDLAEWRKAHPAPVEVEASA